MPSRLLRQALFLQKGAHPDITFTVEAPDEPMTVACDREQLGRALTNLLQNACDAIERRSSTPGANLPPGFVTIRVFREGRNRAIEVGDNGVGLPAGERHRLTEPYVTTREEGTGLGLAIVRKIMEDHGGELRLSDRPGGGALVTLILPDEDARAEPAPSEPGPSARAASHGA